MAVLENGIDTLESNMKENSPLVKLQLCHDRDEAEFQ